MVIELLAVGIAGASAIGGYLKSRQFVRQRLRFVDAVQRPTAPVVAGAIATLAAMPLAIFLPLITFATAIVFGAGVGAGVAAGARDARSLPSA
jgi:hypothetical protein